MYKCTLYLKNKAEWLEYAQNIISQTDIISNEVIAKILTFPFEFGSLNIDS